jgi:hypothetical protein
MAHQIFPVAGNFPVDAAGSVNAGGCYHTSVMERELPPTLRYLVRQQSGVVSRVQVLQAGLSEDVVRFRISSGRWQRIHTGVYATFTGELSRREHLWAAVLSAGPGAALSHQAAAELHRLFDGQAEPVHVTIPHQRRVAAQLIAAAAGGDHSVLEFRYHRNVERAHGLPESAHVSLTRTRATHS